MRQFLVVVAAVSLSLVALGAGPTSNPAAAKRPIPSSWPTITNKTYHFEYRVPSLWTAKEKSDQTTAFLMPASLRSEAPGMCAVSAGDCHAETLEADCADQRKSMLGEAPGAKITADEAALLGSKPAWLLTVEIPYTRKEFRQSGNNPPVQIDVKRKRYHTMVFAIEGKTNYFIDFMGDEPVYQKNFSQLKMITDSFHFAEQTASK
jgi:hypothetical protein